MTVGNRPLLQFKLIHNFPETVSLKYYFLFFDSTDSATHGTYCPRLKH